MAKYCKPMGLYVTYLDCMECDERECRQPQTKREKEVQEMLYKKYFLLDVGQTIYLVFTSKREGARENVVFQCEVKNIMINDKGIQYTATPIKCVTNKKTDISKYIDTMWFKNSNIDTGNRGTFDYPVFTTKEKCIKWLKE